jgi:hypothetical protein
MLGRKDFALVNRSFWPNGQVVGEALLGFAELASNDYSTLVVTQFSGDLNRELALSHRGCRLKISKCGSWTSSSSNILLRIFESVFFMCWVVFALVWNRPRKVYISTDPPVLVPFVVCLYAKLFRAEYYYHLQDIHPEATDILVSMSAYLFKVLRFLDNISLRNAKKIFTLSEVMRDYICTNSGVSHSKVVILDNPALDIGEVLPIKKNAVVYCGNAGRFQRIPLVVAAVSDYLRSGGKLNFTFIGDGAYSGQLKNLSDEHLNVRYLGAKPVAQASRLVAEHTWALLPIDDEVTYYAFPSKSSSYVLAECAILSVCSPDTSVAKWVENNKFGVNVIPDKKALVDAFFEIERSNCELDFPSGMRDKLRMDFFVEKLHKHIFM